MIGDCCGAECQYRPDRVRFWLKMRHLLHELAENPSRAIHQLERPADNDRPSEEPMARARGGGGPRDGWTEWILIAADLETARAAGCSTPEQIARYLCPWAAPDEVKATPTTVQGPQDHHEGTPRPSSAANPSR